MRVRRDPQRLGHDLLALRKTLPDDPLSHVYDFHRDSLLLADEFVPDEGPVEKYGRPDEVQPQWAWIPVV